MTRPGQLRLVPLRPHVRAGTLPAAVAAVAVDALGTTVITVSDALEASGRALALRAALGALAAPRDSAAAHIATVAVRPEWRRARTA